MTAARPIRGAVDRALIDGKFKLPAEMNIESDSQIYTLNWPSRLDRRNIDLSCYCTVEYRLPVYPGGCTAILTTRWDSFVINRKASLNGDMKQAEAFREFAQYWLAGDELKAGRAMARKYKLKQDDLEQQIIDLYADAATREDVENIELQDMDPGFCTPCLRNRHAGSSALHGVWPLVPAAQADAGRWCKNRSGQHGHRFHEPGRFSLRLRRGSEARESAWLLRSLHQVPER